MSMPTWLALIALVWSVMMLGSASQQPEPATQHGLLGFDSSHVIASTDRGPSWRADHRRADEGTSGKPPAALASLLIAGTVLSPPRIYVDPSPRVVTSRRAHTLAQPRAPPANAAARTS